MTSGNVEKKKSSTNSFEEFIISWLPQLTTFILILFTIPILLLVIFCVVVISYNTYTEAISTLISTANNLISPILSLFTLILSAITAYFLIKQFKVQLRINKNQIKVNKATLKQMKISTPKLYLDFYTSLLDDYDEKFRNLLYNRDNNWDISTSSDKSGDKLYSLKDMIEKIVKMSVEDEEDESDKAFTYYNDNYEFKTKLQRLALLLDEFSGLLKKIDSNIQKGNLIYDIVTLEMQISKIGEDYFRNLSHHDFGFNKLMQIIHNTNKNVIEDNPTSEEIETINDNIATYLISINKSYDTFRNLGFIESITDDKYYLLDPSENSSKRISDFSKVHISTWCNEDFKFKRNNTTSNS